MKKLTKTFLTILFLLSAVYFLLPTAEGAVPHLIRYQGFVTDTNGVGLNNEHSIIFQIYDAQTNGNLLWEEKRDGIPPNPLVPITNGNFSVLLGEVEPLDLSFDQDYWLNVKIDGEELSPRQRITSVPTAIRAEQAEKLVGGSLYADSYTKLLLHNNVAATPTTFIDTSAAGHQVGVGFDARIDTTQSKFGGASGLFDGTGDYLGVPDSDDWNFGSGDFTIDCWVRFSSFPVGGQDFVLQSQGDGNDWRFFVYKNPVGELKFQFQVREAYDVVLFVYSDDLVSSLTTNTWYHLAVVRNGGSFYLFKDGSVVPSTTDITGSGSIPNLNAPLYISSSWPFNGWIDELRISKGIARWTSKFTPPDREYSDSSAFAINTDNGSAYYLGKVGFGTTQPQKLLHLNKSSTSSPLPAIRFEDPYVGDIFEIGLIGQHSFGIQHVSSGVPIFGTNVNDSITFGPLLSGSEFKIYTGAISPGLNAFRITTNVDGTDVTQFRVDSSGNTEINGDLTVTGTISGGLKTYVSEWFPISSNTNYPLNHNLGTTKCIITMLVATDSNGSNAATPRYMESGGNWYGSHCYGLTTTQIIWRSENQTGDIGPSRLVATHARLIMQALE